MSKRRIPIVATLVVLVAVAVMVRLGFWQLDRLEQKEAMLARYEVALANPQILSELPDQPLDYLFRRVVYSCARSTEWTSIAGRNSEGETGYVKVENCGDADVVIGWFPGPPHDTVWSGGSITGTIVPGGDRGWRIVSDTPYGRYRRAAVSNPGNISNNHLAYAGQWFFFALTALVIYVLALRRRGKN